MRPDAKGFIGPAGELAGVGSVVYDTGNRNRTAPSSSGPGHSPFTAATRVRIPSGSSRYLKRTCDESQPLARPHEPLFFLFPSHARASWCDWLLHQIL